MRIPGRLVLISLALALASLAPRPAPANEEFCLQAFNDYGDPLAEVTCRCTANNSTGSVWGTLTYAGLSNICAAAEHAGALTEAGEGSITLRGTKACPAYLNSISGNVISEYLGFYQTAFHFPQRSDGACPPAVRLDASKGFYEPGETVSIRYSGLPDDAVFRIAVATAGTRDDDLGERWDYTTSRYEGTFEAGSLPDGQYEARLYPERSAVVLKRFVFMVGSFKVGSGTAGSEGTGAQPSASPMAEAERPVYRQGEPIMILYSGLPGNAEDLIAVVPQGTQDDVLGANWHSYTYGNASGWFQLYQLAQGSYEVRSYFAGELIVRTRSTFLVE